MLDRPIPVQLDRVPIGQALGIIAATAGITLAYSDEQLPHDRVVSLVADRITVGDALRVVLEGTDLGILVLPSGRISLGPRAARLLSRGVQGGGAITGRVSDAATGQALPEVTVTVDATNSRSRTDGAGRYMIGSITPGSYNVTARALGYAPSTRLVVVKEGSEARVDFVLAQQPATLEQVVTTGAGPQRRIELGSAIATISADSVVRTAPVMNITDVISGRAPNVDVVQTSGIVGSGPALRIRGRGSVTLPNDPIYIVDGVRIDGSPGGQVDAFLYKGGNGSNNPTPSRLNDLEPAEIERIEVLRGPSASTEYGTDAANGVVVITTKRGHAGAPRWSATAEEGLSTMPVHFPDNYYSWGHATGASSVPTPCPLVPFTLFGPPGTPGSTAGECIVDSVTRFQPLNHSETSLFGTGYRGHYEVQVSGGGSQAQYFLGGGLANEIGALRMPPTEASRVERERGQAIPRDQLRPNALSDESMRGRVTAGLGGLADLSVNATYVRTAQRSPDQISLLLTALIGPGIRDSLSGYGGPLGGAAVDAPGNALANTGSEDVSRFTGGLSGTWRPTGWLNTRATVGLDDASKTDEVLALPGEGYPLCSDPSCTIYGPVGYRSLGLYRTDLYTVDLGATATLPLGRLLSSKTTAGLQYTDRRTHGSATAVADLALGNPTLNGATIRNELEQHDEAAILGSYVEETVGLAERLFLVGAARVDAGSGFGTAYKAATYPKASVSWMILPEAAGTSLRLRAAYGQSGVQPPAGSALQLYTPAQTYHASGTAPGVLLSTFGSAGLKPERTEEMEGGLDLGLFGSRLTTELTGYAKLSHDALVAVPLEGSLAGGTQLVNLGSVRNRGLEVSVTARVLDTRAAQWDLTVSGSDNENRLVTLGPGVAPIDQTRFTEGPYKQIPGYPLYGLWTYRIRYRDLNHDGIIEPNEVTQDATASYIGPSLSPRELSVNTGMTLFRGHLRLDGQLDYRGGQYLTNSLAQLSDLFQDSRATNDPKAPLALQARAVGTLTDAHFRINSGYLEPASFTRLRELSLTYYAPTRLAAAMRARALSVTVAGRNLALWTKYTGSDPEVSTVVGQNQLTSPGGLPTTAVNPDIVGDFGSVPQMRYGILKVNVEL